jgi:AraC-like DNA-binding protein
VKTDRSAQRVAPGALGRLRYVTAQPRVLLLVTQDTKEEEGRFLRACLEEAGCKVIQLQPGVRRAIGGAEIGLEAVAAAAGMTIEDVRALAHDGERQAAMINGSVKLALDLHARNPVSGILSIGGSMGTALASVVMQAFPVGVPKLMISTIASGSAAPAVAVNDVALLNAVRNTQLHGISEDVYRNGAFGLAGMAHAYRTAPKLDRPWGHPTISGSCQGSHARSRRGALNFPQPRSDRGALGVTRRPRIINYIETHLTDPDLTPTTIAHACRITPRYLHWLFSDVGETIGRYILRRRLAASSRALAADVACDRTIAAIALEHGFNSLTHFGRVFRRAFGVTPSEYRRDCAKSCGRPD